MAALDVLRGNDRLAVESFLQAVRRAVGSEVLEIRLFGSKAQGTDRPESDIDVFVVVRRRTPALVDRIIDLAFDANLAHDVYISPRIVGESVLCDPLWSASPFLRDVVREGVRL
jgi:predicted nucleotidyltransferase